MKKPICVALTDTHMHNRNIALIRSIFRQLFNYCIEHKVPYILHGGDWFTSRAGQSLDVLLETQDIFNGIPQYMHMYIIPGNHDKSDTKRPESYLDIFKHHPRLTVMSESNFEDLAEGFRFHFIPYFDEGDPYLNQLKEARQYLLKDGKNILLTHIGIDGHFDNHGDTVVSGVTKDIFADFDNVFIGHYHDKSGYYMGSAYQGNFGEDAEKGFIVFYDDSTWEQIAFEAPSYHNLVYKVEDINDEFIEDLRKEVESSGDYVKVKVIQTPTEKLQPSQKAALEKAGVKIEAITSAEVYEIEASELAQVFDKQDITKEFDTWAEQKKPRALDYGRKIMTENLK